MDPLRTDGLDHVAMTVSGLERSREFYANVLGLERRHPEWHEPVFMLAEGTGLALVSAESRPVDGDQDAAQPIRVVHIAFRVGREEFDRAQAELPSAGVEPRLEDHGSAHSLYFFDPDGHEVELTTYDV